MKKNISEIVKVCQRCCNYLNRQSMIHDGDYRYYVKVGTKYVHIMKEVFCSYHKSSEYDYSVNISTKEMCKRIKRHFGSSWSLDDFSKELDKTIAEECYYERPIR
jgi:hypothetical protein